MIRAIFKTQLILGVSLLLVCFVPVTKKITIYSIGDSTMATYSDKYLSAHGKEYPLRGWMQVSDRFFKNDVVISNAALSGYSSKSYKTKGEWSKVLTKLKAGDYVFIQFGHNDAKPDSARHTDPETTFKQNITDYINDALAKGAIPILFTSIPRRYFTDAGEVKDTHGKYVSVVRDLAITMNIPLVDLNKMGTELIRQFGPEESKKIYLHIKPGIYAKLPEGKKDNTHLCEFGAIKMAELAVKGVKELNLPLSAHIK